MQKGPEDLDTGRLATPRMEYNEGSLSKECLRGCEGSKHCRALLTRDLMAKEYLQFSLGYEKLALVVAITVQQTDLRPQMQREGGNTLNAVIFV